MGRRSVLRGMVPDDLAPAGAQVIDLQAMTVVPGLVDAHNHLALTFKEVPRA